MERLGRALFGHYGRCLSRVLAGSFRSNSTTEPTVRLIDYFDASAQRYPSKTAFIQPDGARLTYAEVEQQSRSIASALHASRLPETGKVAVYSPNDARAFIAMLTIFRSGRVWGPLNARNTLDDNSAFMNYTDVESLFYHSSFENEVRQLRASAPQLKQCICLDRDGRLGPSLSEFSSAAAWARPMRTKSTQRSRHAPIQT
jgi:acyl-CoA synthetase (AMP-forming)/AMP-acid ligase II